jgi:hypothetical protein
MRRSVPIILFLAVVAVAYAQPPQKLLTATGKEYHAAMVDPGTWLCVGGQATGAAPPCSVGTKQIIIHGLSSRLVYTDVTGPAAAMLQGENITLVHANLDENYYGQLLCTFEWTVPGMGGRWEGTCNATADQMRGIVINRATAHGRGGQLEGKTLEFYAINQGQYSLFIAAVKDEQSK